MEKANADFEANKKEFWSEGQRVALRNDSGISVTSTKGVLQSHYQRLGSCSVDAFDNNWKQEVDSVVLVCDVSRHHCACIRYYCCMITCVES